jgi:hypothetical protein
MTRKDFLRLVGAALTPPLGLRVRGQSARPKNVLLKDVVEVGCLVIGTSDQVRQSVSVAR